MTRGIALSRRRTYSADLTVDVTHVGGSRMADCDHVLVPEKSRCTSWDFRLTRVMSVKVTDVEDRDPERCVISDLTDGLPCSLRLRIVTGSSDSCWPVIPILRIVAIRHHAAIEVVSIVRTPRALLPCWVSHRFQCSTCQDGEEEIDEHEEATAALVIDH